MGLTFRQLVSSRVDCSAARRVDDNCVASVSFVLFLILAGISTRTSREATIEERHVRAVECLFISAVFLSHCLGPVSGATPALSSFSSPCPWVIDKNDAHRRFFLVPVRLLRCFEAAMVLPLLHRLPWQLACLLFATVASATINPSNSSTALGQFQGTLPLQESVGTMAQIADLVPITRAAASQTVRFLVLVRMMLRWFTS
jgi:hypothetical protein